MKKLWNWLFPEYYVVKAFYAVWHLNTDFGPIDENCRYEIQYSALLNKFKLVSIGYKAKDHQMYSKVAVPAFIELVNAKNKKL